MAYAIAWNEAAPIGASVSASTIDTELQNLKKSIRERMNNFLSNEWETDGNDPKLIDTFGLTGTPVVAVVYTNAAFSLPSGATTAIDCVAETLDTGSFHDNSTNPERLTISTAAYYHITSNMQITPGASGAVAHLYIRKNGSIIASQRVLFAGSSNIEQLFVTIIDLAAVDDYYDTAVLQASGDTWATGTTAISSFFMIEKMIGTT